MKLDSRGLAASKLILILAIALILVGVAVFSFFRAFKSDNSVGGIDKQEAAQNIQTQVQPGEPMYDITAAGLRFVLIASEDLGSIMPGDGKTQKDLVTTEKFIMVTVGAQNKGKVNTKLNAWAVGNIVDSEGRNFIAINDKAHYFLPKENPCGAILKPEFEPTPCVKIYEVSKASTNLKVQVINKTDKKIAKESFYLDLKLEE